MICLRMQILSGQSDVVAVKDQEWLSDPFKMTEREKKLNGRGTADMKSFLAACLDMLEGLIKKLVRLKVMPLIGQLDDRGIFSRSCPSTRLPLKVVLISFSKSAAVTLKPISGTK